MQKRFDAVLNAQGVKGGGWWDRHHLHSSGTRFRWKAAGRVAVNGAGHGQRYGRLGDAGRRALMMPLATLVRLERWQEVLAEPKAWACARLTWPCARHGLAAHRPAGRPRLRPRSWRACGATGRAAGTQWGVRTPSSEHERSAAHGQPARTERRFDDAATQLRKAADLDDELGTDPPMLGGGAR